ncbi:MAG: EAL domain-containing protein, partial [Hyphomicrobiales bacterium]|nr:EAL domain-containing protein [Hyphomicrobiales bacterium]
RITGLVALVAAIVTLAAMFVLARTLLEPMLDLRARLSKAASDPEGAERYAATPNRRDELGALQEAANALMRQTSLDIRRISVGEEELRRARMDLERKVEERTRELTREVTDRRQAEEQLRESEKQLIKQANFDDLTGLPNRPLAMDRLSQALSLADRDQGTVVLMFIDLDNFKNVNDTLGHAIGDELLVQTSRRLASCLRRSDTVAHLERASVNDTVARIGGDEFMVILPRIAAEEHAEIVARKILATCAQPFQLSGHEVFVTASIGITLYSRDGKKAHDLMVNADTAMYEAKEAGRNAFRFFAPEMNTRAIERLRIESRLRQALDRDALFLHYQPVVDIRTRTPVGAEVLLRWVDDELGSVSPERFIPVAEGSGLIIPIGEWVLRRACREAARLGEKTGRPLRMAVNVSSRQFRGTNLAETVAAALDDAGLPADRLELEITESLLIEEESEAATGLMKLRELGVRLSIDDFGTGYSALGYLKRFPVDTLKIDRSFINEVTRNREDATLTRAAIAMAHSLGMEVIAEGVETEEQLDFLKALGCEYAQGYLFGKPLPADDSARYFTGALAAGSIRAGD